jgi:L-threonylcarbamoyladenylate synthase
MMTAEPGTQVFKADSQAIAAGARCLAAGGLVAFPTETVYGLGADAGNGEAVARLYAAKGRPAFNPLIAHVADSAGARRLARFDAAAERLAAAFWPGPLTLVLPRLTAGGVADLAVAGLDSVAARVPSHPVARALLQAFGGPVVAPSANRSGHVSPTGAAHVLADLRGRIDMVIDAGPCAVGVESTIVACLGAPTLLRPGGLAREQIERVLGQALAAAPADTTRPPAPGMLASHYAPKARLRLDAEAPRAGEALLAFGPAPRFSGLTLNLSTRGDLIEAAANLFSHLRALDASGATTIAVMMVPREGLGEAINDRLARAAAPKP